MIKLSPNQLVLLLCMHIGVDSPLKGVRADDTQRLKILELSDGEKITEKGMAFIDHIRIFHEDRFKVVYQP